MIYYFSGTGNSRAVAQELSRLLDMRAFDISAKDCPSDLCNEQIVIWVFPIYSWGLPPAVVDFIGSINAVTEALHYMVCTCGDDIGRADRQWMRLMAAKGFDIGAAYSVQMPNTYTLLPGFDVDSNEVEQKKLSDMPARVKYIVGMILNASKESDVVSGGVSLLKSGVVYPLFCKWGCNTRPFKTSNYCVGCGLCATQCPNGNMTMENGRPRWGNNCTMCLRCYHICPHHAVSYGKVTSGKGQYRTMILRGIDRNK